MTLIERITPDLKTAMRAKDQVALRSIRAIKAAILLMETDGTGDEITEEREIKLLQKMVKQRKESLDIYVKQGREDLASVEREEIVVIEKYLPEQMSEEELTVAIQNIMTTTGASSMKDMGRVMGMASKEFAGKEDGKMIASIVKNLLNA